MSLNGQWPDPIASESFTLAYLLRKSKEYNDIGITPLQANKLAYILHGWTLGIKDFPLFNNITSQIQAWRYGPVVVGIYHLLKPFGSSPVTIEKIENPPGISDGQLLRQYRNVVSEDVAGFMEENKESTDHLDELYDIYIEFDGNQLINMTHEVGTPWYQCRARGFEKLGLFGQKHIPDSVIRLYYRNFAKKYNLNET